MEFDLNMTYIRRSSKGVLKYFYLHLCAKQILTINSKPLLNVYCYLMDKVKVGVELRNMKVK